MTAYEVPAGDVGVHAKQLAASVVDTVTFADDLAEVEVLSDGSAAIYVSFGTGSTPAVADTGCWQVQENTAGAVLRPRMSGPTIVKLISAGTPVYSVART